MCLQSGSDEEDQPPPPKINLPAIKLKISPIIKLESRPESQLPKPANP